MAFDRAKVREALKAFDFKRLFIEELGWDRPPTTPVTARLDREYVLNPVAHKRGMVVFFCEAEVIPDHATRQKIDRQATKSAHEHLIVYTDSAGANQVWQWVKREPGRPAASRHHAFHKDQPGDSLIQKLEALVFDIDEEEALTITTVAGRARRAFDVDRVTKRFYDRFKTEISAFLGFVKGIQSQGDREWYASLMLNRLMFIYFIQKKGFLDGDTDYLRKRLRLTQSSKGRDKFHSFYRHFLLRLFHEGLGGQQRTSELDALLGRVPYLNGGLFDVHDLERANTSIAIADEAFERVFDFFDAYNWHLDARPLRADNEINPDVLGYIFEKYINQKQMGAYYTKEDITEYISRNTVVPFLLDAAHFECRIAFENPKGPTVWDLLQADPDRYIYPAVRHGAELPLPAEIAAGVDPPTALKPVGDGPTETLELRKTWNRPAPDGFALPTETWREVVARRTRYETVNAKLAAGEVRSVIDLTTLNLDLLQFAQDIVDGCEGPDLLRAVWRAIERVTILDPTCGSGAFLFAALNILEPLYEACLNRMEAFIEDLERLGDHHPEQFSDFRRILARVDAHPNRRYFIFKSIILNNLFGVDIMEEAVEICKLRLFLKLAAEVELDTTHDNLGIEPLPDIDFNIKAGNTLVGFATYESVQRAVERKLDFENTTERIAAKAASLQDAFDTFRQAQTAGDAVPTEQKRDLQEGLAALQDELNHYLAVEYAVDPADASAYSRWLNSHQPLHWLVEFYGVMSRGGFDVIIGNPPYVEYRLVRDTYTLPKSEYTSEPAANLYAYCMERSCHLLSTSGRFGMIVPAGILGLNETESLRKVVTERFDASWFSTYAIRPSKLFEGVDQRLCICLQTRRESGDVEIWTTRYQHWNAEERPHLFPNLQYAPSRVHPRLDRISQVGSREAADVLEKLELRSDHVAAHYYTRRNTGCLMHYHRSPRYWIRAMDFEPYFKSATRTRSVHHFRDLHFTDEGSGKFVGAVLNSTLFFIWFVTLGNGRNITGTDVERMPIGEIDDPVRHRAIELFDELMSDYKKHSIVRERQDSAFQEFRPSRSKSVLDEIDRLLAQHYGFTEAELDYIVNYDVKYRLGPDAEDDEG